MEEASQGRFARHVELAATVLLAMAAVATAWAAYQSARWHGEQAKAQSGSAFSQQAGRFIQRADNYSLAVVLFAASLFFAGISTRLRSLTTRMVVVGLGYALFLSTVIWIATLTVSVSV
jgi:hypothetical protein